MIALIDADSLLYRVGFSCEDHHENDAIRRMAEVLEELIFDDLVQCSEHQVFLSGSTNFRFDVAKTLPYKGNRDNLKRPKHLQILRQYVIDAWKAKVSKGKEADDDVCIAAHKRGSDSCIIAHIDKDLDQIPGNHFNYVKKTFYSVSEEEGLRNLFVQVLTGDRIDNIQGLSRVGPVKAKKILADCKTEDDMFAACINAYDGRIDRVIENLNLLYLLTKEDDNKWHHDQLVKESAGVS